jgi:hypothetical protein
MRAVIRASSTIVILVAIMVAQTATTSANIPDDMQVFDPISNEGVALSGNAVVTVTAQAIDNGVQVQVGSQAQGSGTGTASGNNYQLSGSDTFTTTAQSLPANIQFRSKASLTAPNGQTQNVVIILRVNVDSAGNPIASVQAVQTSSM